MAWNVSLGESVECFDLTLLDDGKAQALSGEKENCADDSVTFTFLCKNVGSTTKADEAPETRADNKGIGSVNQTGVCKTRTTLAHCDSNNMNGNNSKCTNPMSSTQTKKSLSACPASASVNTNSSPSGKANIGAYSQRDSSPQTAVVDLSKLPYPTDRNVKLPERNTNSNQQAMSSARAGTFNNVVRNTNFPARPSTNQNQQARVKPQPQTNRKDNGGDYPYLTDLILGNKTDIPYKHALASLNSSKGMHHTKPYSRPNVHNQIQKSNQSSCWFEERARKLGRNVQEYRELAEKNMELYRNIHSWEKSKQSGDSHIDKTANKGFATAHRNLNNTDQSTVKSTCNNQSTSSVCNSQSASSINQTATCMNSQVPNRPEKSWNGLQKAATNAQNRNESMDMEVLFHTMTREPSKSIFQQEYKAQTLIEKLHGSFKDGGNALADKYVSKAVHLERERYFGLRDSSPSSRAACNNFYDRNLLRLLYHLEQNLRQLLQEQYNKQTYGQTDVRQKDGERRSL